MAAQIYYGGKILTYDGCDYEAMVVADGKINFLGTLSQALEQAPQGERIDLRGACAAPGFYESHGHISYDSAMFTHLDFAKVRYDSFADACRLIEGKTRERRDADLVVISNYDEGNTAERRLFTREDLDKISNGKKVLVAHVSAHMGFLNTAALECEEGFLEKFPTGKLGDKELLYFYSKYCPKPTISYMEEKLLAAQQEALAAGVTTMSDAGFMGQGFMFNDVLLGMDAAGKLKIQVAKSISYNNRPVEEIAEKLDQLEVQSEKIYYVKTLKTFYDGSIQAGTAYLTEPYLDNAEQHRPADWHGVSTYSYEKLLEQTMAAYANGLSITVHVNGDQAMDDVLRAVETAQEKYGVQRIRSCLVHAQTIRKDQIQKAKELDMVISFFNSHVYYWGDVHVGKYLGAERGNRISPLKEALDQNVIFTLHCDYPVVPENPLLAIDAAVNRRTKSGAVIGAELRIDPMDAFKAYTLYPAMQNGQEDTKGSIAVGKDADLVILDRDPLTADRTQIKEIRVKATIIRGSVVYKAD